MAFNNTLRSMPPVTKNIIIICFLIWAVEMLFPRFGNVIIEKLGLHLIGASDFNPIQPVTYMFVHSNDTILHVLFNMFTLWMFGRTLEQVWGSRRFFVFYMVCGIGAALVQEGVWALTWQHDYVTELARQAGLNAGYVADMVREQVAAGDPTRLQNMEMFKSMLTTVGASGAIFGLLLGFAFVFPNMPLYLFFIPVPIKAKWMVLGYAVIEFFLGINGGGTIAHFAHLGGMIFGLVLLLYWRKNGTLRGNGFY